MVWSICADKEIYVHRMDGAGGLRPKGTDWPINRSIIEIRSRIDVAIYRLNSDVRESPLKHGYVDRAQSITLYRFMKPV